MWRARKVLISAAASGPVLGFLAASPANAAGIGSDYAAVDRDVQSQVDANHFPGVSRVVVEGNDLAYTRGLGHDPLATTVRASV